MRIRHRFQILVTETRASGSSSSTLKPAAVASSSRSRPKSPVRSRIRSGMRASPVSSIVDTADEDRSRPRSLLAHPNLGSTALEANVVHQLVDEIDSAAVLGIDLIAV